MLVEVVLVVEVEGVVEAVERLKAELSITANQRLKFRQIVI